jgi:hypothetical protein
LEKRKVRSGLTNSLSALLKVRVRMLSPFFRQLRGNNDTILFSQYGWNDNLIERAQLFPSEAINDLMMRCGV